MATKAELVQWLAQFPDDAKIECITSTRIKHMGWIEDKIEVVPFETSEIGQMFAYCGGQSYEIEADYNVRDKTSKVQVIRLGRLK